MLMDLNVQIIWLLVLALPVACISWTVTHEEIFKELREFCERRGMGSHGVFTRKFFYLFTCEYCFSHYVAIAALALTQYTLLFPDWRGYVLAGFSLVWIANIYMNIYAVTCVVLKKERLEVKKIEQEVE